MSKKTFILKLTLLTVLLLSSYFGAVYNLTNGTVDETYYKFTYKSNTLILGLSRAREAISPSIMQSELKQKYTSPGLNFAFERTQSEYGENYLNAIRQKIDTTKKNGLFILSVSPGCFMAAKNSSPAQIEEMDSHTIVGKMTSFNSNPNFEYVRKGYQNSLYRGFLKTPEVHRRVHVDGWLEYKDSIKGSAISEERIKVLKEETKKGYLRAIEVQEPSEYRLQSFEKTIEFLKTYGKVLMVRIPIDPQVLKHEQEYWPEFDEKMEQLSRSHELTYLNYSDHDNHYTTYDGSHLVSSSARRFSKKLSQDINALDQ